MHQPAESHHVLPPHPQVQGEIDALQLAVDASELHGSLCGLLCGGARVGPRDWLQRLALEADAAPPEDGVLQQLFAGSVGQLDDPGMGFELLMPSDEAPMAQRGEALLGWCRGFLGGFGLAAGAAPPITPEASEALEDLARIAATQLSYEHAEADETALAEVSEFVRIAALLLHDDCVHAAQAGKRLLH